MKKKLVLLFLCALLLACVASSCLAAENLIANYDIEKINGSGLPEGWSLDMWNTDGTSELTVSSEGHDGTHCLLVDNLSDNDARFEQVIEVEPSATYRVSCLVRVEGCSDGAMGANLSIKDTFVSTESVTDTAGAWVPIEMYGVTGEDQTEIVLMARVGSYGSLNRGKAWFDDFVMEKVDSVPGGSFVASFATLEPIAAQGDGEDDEEENIFGRIGRAFPYVFCVMYLLICVAFLLAAMRSKLPSVASAQSCRNTFWVLAALALLLRMLVGLLTRGYDVDMNCFTAWAMRMAEEGPAGFYSADVFCDYPPGYMYVLWAAGLMIKGLGLGGSSPATWLIVKLLPMLADIACAYLVFRVARDTLGDWVGALLGVLFAFHPVLLIDSAAWGQADSVLMALLLCSMLLAANGRFLAAVPVYALAVLVKPQALMLGPLGLAMLIVEVIESKSKARAVLTALLSALLALLTILLLSLPFMLGLPKELVPDTFLGMSVSGPMARVAWLLNQYGGALSGSYNYATVNACNLYELLGMDWTELSSVPSITVFSWIMLGVSYAYSLFLYVRAKDRGKAFLCGAVLLAMAFAFGPKMHERYMIPALGLLVLAYVFDRDVRLLIALILLTATQFLNISLVLEYDYLMYVDKTLLVHAISLVNVLCAAFLAWTGWEMCVSGHVISFTRVYKPAAVQEEKQAKVNSALADSLLRPKDARLGMKRRDYVGMTLLTLIYAVTAFTNLGTTKAPQTQWQATASGEQITFDLGQVDDFVMNYYGGICNSTFLVEMSEDGQVWSEAHYASYDVGQIFQWLWYRPCEKDDNGSFYPIEGAAYAQRARYIRLTAERAGLALREVGFVNRNGDVLPVASVYSVGGSTEHLSDPKAVLDEQETIPAYPSYLNGMYFDEIYHGRTAYEFHTRSPYVYEFTHPPLGKVLIMLGIRMFGMSPFGWRFMPALFGVMMVPLMYLICKQLFKRSSLAFFGTFLLAVDCMHFTQSRLATIDVFAVFFIMLMYLFMFRYAQMSFYHVKLGKTLLPLGLCGVSMGLAISCKWIGLYGATGLAFIFFFTMAQRFREFRYAKARVKSLDQEGRRIAQRAIKQFWHNTLVTLLCCLAFFILIPALIYYGTYYWHLAPSGNFTPQGVWEMQKSMYAYHSSISWDTHWFESKWYEWPLIVKPMWYYSGQAYIAPDMVSSISCMGNPVVWWGGLIALIWVFARLITVCRGDRRYLYIAVGFLAEYLPWIIVPRSTFIYHYFASVPFIILATVALFEWIRKRDYRVYRVVSGVYCAAALILFIGFYPLMSGLKIPRAYARYLRWFNWYNY